MTDYTQQDNPPEPTTYLIYITHEYTTYDDIETILHSYSFSPQTYVLLGVNSNQVHVSHPSLDGQIVPLFPYYDHYIVK